MCFLEVKIMIVEATIEIRVNSHYDEPQLSVVVIHVSIPHLCHHLPVATTVNAPDNQFRSSIPFFTLCQASFFRYLCSHQVYLDDVERTLQGILMSTTISILSLTSIVPHFDCHTQKSSLSSLYLSKNKLNKIVQHV